MPSALHPAGFAGSQDNASNALVIGLVNLMPPAARRRTELQFGHLLQSGQSRRGVDLQVFHIGQTPETAPSVALRALFASRLDGLIVTGTEPQADNMDDEPCWPALASIVDWAAEHTISTLWSCFAAHAAVYRLDQIRRQRLPKKLCGVFECTKAAEHSIVAGVSDKFLVPQSRHNTLPEAALRDHGYIILSDAWRVGADSFTRQQKHSQFLFLQGHPEYQAETLADEYRRDVRRFFDRQRRDQPEPPEGYDGAALTTEHCWREPSQRLGASWLDYIAARKIRHADLAA